MKCSCGNESHVRVKDLLYGKSKTCYSCASVPKGKQVPRDVLAERAKRGHETLRKNHEAEWGKYIELWGVDEVERLKNVMRGAKSRCCSPNQAQYKDYGGRGIEFRFPSPIDATKWVLDNLGGRPDADYSLDRIDNNAQYEPGNMRWASRLEQRLNQRERTVREQGAKIKEVLAQRNDITYECVRNWLKQGYTVNQILQRDRHARSSL